MVVLDSVSTHRSAATLAICDLIAGSFFQLAGRGRSRFQVAMVMNLIGTWRQNDNRWLMEAR
jgi:hypothetical protein